MVTDKYIEYNGKFIYYSMHGTKTSDITIDKKSGWIKSAIINQKISGIADIKDKQTDPGGLEYLSLDMASEISISE